VDFSEQLQYPEQHRQQQHQQAMRRGQFPPHGTIISGDHGPHYDHGPYVYRGGPY
jgi:hypothetical protein